MKKILTALAAISALGLASPAFAQSSNGGGNQGYANQGYNANRMSGSQANGEQGWNRNDGGNGNQSASSEGRNSRMSESEIKTVLRDQGYSDFHDVNRDGDTYKISKAKRYGRKVEDLKVDAQTAEVQNAKDLNEDQAKELLKDDGYSNIKHIKKHGDHFTAEAKENGHKEDVRLDRQSGYVNVKDGNGNSDNDSDNSD